MAEGWPTYNALKISAVFVQSTARKYCCYDISKQLRAPMTTVRDTLHALMDHGWLVAEKENVNRSVAGNRSQRILFRITSAGLEEAVEYLSAVQIQDRLMDLIVLEPRST